MKKKILSMVAVVAIAFSALTSFTVANAEIATPAIKYVFDFVDNGGTFDDTYDAYWDYEDLDGAPVYDITLTITGFTKKASVKEDGVTVAYTGAIIDGVQGVAARLTTSKEYIIIAEAANSNAGSGTPLVGHDDTKNKIAYSYGATSASQGIKTPDTVLATWTIMAADGSEITDLKIAAHEDANLATRFIELYDGTSKTPAVSVYAASNTIVGYPASQGGSKEAVQAGDTFTDAAGAQAVAYYVDLDSTASEKTGRWYATIGGTAMKTVNTFAIPNISAENVKLGLVYKGAETVSDVVFKWE